MSELTLVLGFGLVKVALVVLFAIQIRRGIRFGEKVAARQQAEREAAARQADSAAAPEPAETIRPAA